MTTRSLCIITALLAVIAVLAYLYYQSTRNDIVIQLPRVEIKP